jgi:hypothetical protein
MTDTSHAIAKKFCVIIDDVEAEDYGECQDKNIFNGRLTEVFIGRFHKLMVA